MASLSLPSPRRVRGYLGIAADWLGYLFAQGTPVQQMIAATVVGVILIVSSYFSLGATLLLIWIPILAFLIGSVRLLWRMVGVGW